jgi:hypothetical protein
MITPISITNLPRDLMIPILLESTDTLATLKVYQQVSKEFKAALDDPGFLHTLLVKFKGPSFSDKIYQSSPRKFLLLDRDITIAFRMKVAMKKDFNEFNKEILKTTASVALKNLNLFTIANGSNITYFRLAKTEVKNLSKVDIAKQKQWQECIINIATRMTEHKFSVQIIIKGHVFFGQKIESGFLNPNEKMQKLIKDYEVTDVFFADPESFVIQAHKGNELNPSILEEAVFEPEQYKFSSTCQLLSEFLREVSLTVVDGHIVAKLNDVRQQEIITKLKELNLEQKESLERSFDSEYNQFLLGKFFPGIWPHNLKDLGEDKCKEQINRLIITGFSKSIQLVIDEDERSKAELSFDPIMRGFLLNKLKEPSIGLKECFEKCCGAEILALCQNIIFPEIWDKAPFNNEQGYILSLEKK